MKVDVQHSQNYLCLTRDRILRHAYLYSQLSVASKSSELNFPPSTEKMWLVTLTLSHSHSMLLAKKFLLLFPFFTVLLLP